MTTIDTAAIVLLGAIASAWDLKSRRVPNVITLGFPVIALIVHVALHGATGAFDTATGWLIGLLLFLPLFALGGMGAGDVKLLAAFGAWLGPWNAVETALAAGIIGGVLAIGLALSSNYMKQAFTNVLHLVLYWRSVGLRPHPSMTLDTHEGPRLAYAIPISLGAIVAWWVQ